MTQEEYDTFSKLRIYVYQRMDSFESSVEKIKTDYDQKQQAAILSGIIELVLLVAHTEKGRILFSRILEYVKDFDSEFAEKYWNLYEEEIENIVESGFFKVLHDDK
ncbi:hypothetical protein [Dysgonomonas sp. ZJ709]|uniref:hypothetical protein n=1 Tax=Dysgonomonas sp. ZJ709 TaxID=2709797 RepID=UPI0013EBA7C9|nr:hypothetical protein [Dysgonomonas sp. ZJ709]